MSYSVPAGYVEEDINEDIREALGDKQSVLESVEVLSEAKCHDLPLKIQERLGIACDQKNVLVRITLRHLERILESQEANAIYDDVYRKVDHGTGGYM
jgi:phenylalanyl-tRNA synthetase alpha chain